MSDNVPLPLYPEWPSFPFQGELHVKPLDTPVEVEPPRHGENMAECLACNAPDDKYIWVNDHWRVRSLDHPTGLPVVLVLEPRSHLDLGDLPNLLSAELGIMTVRVERAIRSLDGVARVHVNRWGDTAPHLSVWFLARPHGYLQLRGSFLSMWNDLLPPGPEEQWRENLALVAAWLAEFDGTALAEPPRIHWTAPSRFSEEIGESDAFLGTGADSEDEYVADTNPTSEATDQGTAEGSAESAESQESTDSAERDDDDELGPDSDTSATESDPVTQTTAVTSASPSEG